MARKQQTADITALFEAAYRETPEQLLDELHAGIGCLLELTCRPVLHHEQIGFIARALDAELERLREALDKKEQRAAEAA